ncbi:MAG TPA: phage holin family protein [Chloroflexota bacterium]|nr:phage holin family protein [Chloroflexota bacterium]
MAFTLRDRPDLDGRHGSNGRAGPEPDPAHGGPLPQATFAELIGRLINDVSDLADRQIELAKQEVGEAKDEAIGAVKRLAIGAGIAAAAGLLVVIWAWTAFIWFFNWVFGFISFPTPLGTQSLAWVGWLLGVLLPGLAGYVAYKRYIRPGISRAMKIWPPLPRTRETLKEDLEWVRHLRTLRAR